MDVWCEAMREDRMVLLCGGGGESANVEDGSVRMRRALVGGESSDAVCEGETRRVFHCAKTLGNFSRKPNDKVHTHTHTLKHTLIQGYANKVKKARNIRVKKQRKAGRITRFFKKN